MKKIKLSLISLVLSLIQWAGADTGPSYVNIEELNSSWGQDLNNSQNFEEMLLWTELAFKHSVVSAITAYEETSSALGFETMTRTEKISIPLSLGAAFAGGMIGSELIRRRSLAQTRAFNTATALQQVSRYRGAVVDISAENLEKRLQFAKARKASALNQAVSRDLASTALPLSNTSSFLQRYSKSLKVFGFASLAAGGASAAYAYASNETADIHFENSQDMKSLQEEFQADIELLSTALGLSQ